MPAFLLAFLRPIGLAFAASFSALFARLATKQVVDWLLLYIVDIAIKSSKNPYTLDLLEKLKSLLQEEK